MKPALYLLSIITLTHSVWAETRNITREWHLATADEETVWLLDWPVKSHETFTLRYPDGKPYLQATLQDSHHDDLLASENMTGKYRFYYPNGKIKKEGEWDKTGTSVGLQTTYNENGSPAGVKRYLADGWSVDERTYYDNGQLSYEGIDFDGEEYKESRYYAEDGVLIRKKYRKTVNSVEKEIDESFDDKGALQKRIEKYGRDPLITVTYGAEGKIIEKKTLMINLARSKTETFDGQGQLTDLLQYRTDGPLQKEGEQVTSHDGQTTYVTYINGVKEGEEKTVKAGHVIAYSHFEKGQETGDGFALNDDADAFLFTTRASDKHPAVSYSAGRDYISSDDRGMPQVKLPFNIDSRKLPKPGTVWEYSSDGKRHSKLELISADDKTATWRTGHGEIKENLNSYTWIMPEQPPQDRQILSFPLTPGKVWNNRYQTRVTVPQENGAEWEYTYSATSSSKIAGIEKITVAGGTFDTLLITRDIHWTKSRPRFTNTSTSEMVCETPACEVSGYTAEVIWYAPEIGRAVMKAVEINGSSQVLMNSPDSLLKHRNALISELTRFGPASVENKPASDIRYAHQVPDSAFSQGFALMPNNTWEFRMIHSPMIE